MYPCIKCGLCCKHIDKAVEIAGEIFSRFPYKWDETGRCEKLDENDMCMVYDNRPLICNIDRVADKFGLDKEEFYAANINACNELLALHGDSRRI